MFENFDKNPINKKRQNFHRKKLFSAKSLRKCVCEISLATIQ